MYVILHIPGGLGNQDNQELTFLFQAFCAAAAFGLAEQKEKRNILLILIEYR